MNGSDRVAGRALDEPALSRLPLDAPDRAQILDAHRKSLSAREDGYLDPATGYWVFNARYLLDQGFCCENGCRHCPYVDDRE